MLSKLASMLQMIELLVDTANLFSRAALYRCLIAGPSLRTVLSTIAGPNCFPLVMLMQQADLRRIK